MIVFELDDNASELPSYINEFIFVKKRKFPLFLEVWDHERDEMDKKENLGAHVDGNERD